MGIIFSGCIDNNKQDYKKEEHNEQEIKADYVYELYLQSYWEYYEPVLDRIYGEYSYLNASEIFERSDFSNVTWIDDNLDLYEVYYGIKLKLFVKAYIIKRGNDYIINVTAKFLDGNIINKRVWLKYEVNNTHITLRFLTNSDETINSFSLTYRVGNGVTKTFTDIIRSNNKRIGDGYHLTEGYEGIDRGVVEDIQNCKDHTLYVWYETDGKSYNEVFDFSEYKNRYNRVIWIEFGPYFLNVDST